MIMKIEAFEILPKFSLGSLLPTGLEFGMRLIPPISPSLSLPAPHVLFVMHYLVSELEIDPTRI